MGISKRLLVVSLAAASTRAASCTPNLTQAYPDATVKEVDVVIVGGGGSGANAAINFYDAGVSVIVVEKEDHLVRDLFPLPIIAHLAIFTQC